MPAVLGRVTTRTLDVPRGPDVVHRVRVAREWLTLGRPLELELPRNVTCAACEGGGCDLCERSGAITLRGRGEPAELVQVTMPEPDPDAPPDSPRGLMIRIPEQGGLPAAGSGLPRGLLLLRLIAAEQSDPSVRLVPLHSFRPPAPVARVLQSLRPVLQSLPTKRGGARVALWLALLFVVLLALFALKRLVLH